MKKRVLAGVAALFIVGMLIASIGVFSIDSEEKPPPREAVWTDAPVKVLGTSVKTMNIRSVLSEATSHVSIINDSISLMDSIQPGDILLIDGHWSKNQPLDRLSSAVKNIILNGNPVLLVLGDPLLLKKALEGENVSHGWGDNRLVYGIKYSPDHDYSVTFGCGSHIITDTVIRNAILDGLDWAVENIRNDLVRAYDGPFDPALYGTTSQSYWDYRITIDETEYCYPHGDFRVIASYYQLIGDSTPSYNWYSSQLKLISIPGELLWDNNYHTGDMWVKSHIDGVYWLVGNQILHDWDPTTSTGVDYMSVNIGTTAGVDGAGVSVGFSWTFDSPDVDCYDEGNAADHLCHWHFDVNQFEDVSKYQYYVEPGHTVRVNDRNGYLGSYEIYQDTYQVRWGKRTWYGHTDWQTYTLYISATIYPA